MIVVTGSIAPTIFKGASPLRVPPPSLTFSLPTQTRNSPPIEMFFLAYDKMKMS